MTRFTTFRFPIIIVILVLSWVILPPAAHAQFAQFAQFQSASFSPPQTVTPAPGSTTIDSASQNSIYQEEDLPSPVLQLASGSAMFSFSGNRPSNLGVTDGKLAACPSSPNCVSSQAPKADEEHSTDPLPYTKSPAETIEALKSVIESMERTQIITEESNYLYAEFTSALMGFVDDVEFYVDEDAKVIHVRSASRLGKSDLGVNRKRVEEIRAKLASVA